MADCTRCVSEKLCRYNDGFNLYCKEDYECPHFVEVVRCKDCKYWGGVVFGYRCRKLSGMNTQILTSENDFCSYGERKEK